MKAFNDYDKTQAYTKGDKLPVGGYILKILAAKVEPGTNGNSDQLVVSYDIAEGDQAGFYQKQYSAQMGEDKKWKGATRIWLPKDDGSEKDEWTKRKFKTFIVRVEESNDGFHWDWDENKLKGKLVGGVFNEKEYSYNGHEGFYTNLHNFENVETIRNDDFKIPDPTYLKNKGGSGSSSQDWANVPEGTQEEIPF